MEQDYDYLIIYSGISDLACGINPEIEEYDYLALTGDEDHRYTRPGTEHYLRTEQAALRFYSDSVVQKRGFHVIVRAYIERNRKFEHLYVNDSMSNDNLKIIYFFSINRSTRTRNRFPMFKG